MQIPTLRISPCYVILYTVYKERVEFYEVSNIRQKIKIHR